MRHKWGPPVRKSAYPNDVDRTERKCERCGVLRITMHPPSIIIRPWVEWEINGIRYRSFTHTPPCEAK